MRTGFSRVGELVDGAKPTGSEALLSGRESSSPPLSVFASLRLRILGLSACRTRCTPGLSPRTSPRRHSRGWTCPTTGSTQHTPPRSSRTGSASPTARTFSASRASTNHRRRPSSSTAASSTPTLPVRGLEFPRVQPVAKPEPSTSDTSNATWEAYVDRDALSASLARTEETYSVRQHPADAYSTRSEGVPEAWNATVAHDMALAYHGQIAEVDNMVGRVLVVVDGRQQAFL